ncbi:MAG TPA: hypothetical protein VD763_09475 [Candidatus Saccharimonadales bacterium]|nr:hypothetical protein [Candidatus Saccharimonadales bacterium]
MPDPTTTDEPARIQALRDAFVALRPRVSAGAPWPMAVAFGVEPEASWGPPEVLAHLAEMLPFWMGELERIVDGEPAPVPFGRVTEDTVRIGLIERDRTLPVRVLFDRIDAGLADWGARLATLGAADRLKLGLHPRLGPISIETFLERFVLGHADDHVAQLEEILATRPA